MQKLLLPLIILSLLLVSSISYLVPVYADEIEDLQKQIDQLNKAREQSVAATKPLEGQLDSLKRQLASIQARLDDLSANIQKRQKEIDSREERLAEQNAILETRIRSYYIRSYSADPLLVILSSNSPGDLFKELGYRLAAAKKDRSIIIQVTREVEDLLSQKEKLEKDKASLALIQADVDKNAKFFGGEVAKAKAYQADLSGKIASLTARQQEILNQRLAALNIPRSAYTFQGGCIDDRGISPGISPAFAFFTYGVPNRVGLNQYGSKGRAEAGQSAQQILSAYYNADYTQGYNQGINIHVTGSNEYGQSFDETWNIDEYLKHIYEMPTSWPASALRAQAIAARSYALSYTQNGASSICPSQSCQVVKKELNDGAWQQAVEDTKGIVLTAGGSPIKAWFSSTHGGYVFSSSEIGWNGTGFTKHATDTTSGSAGSFTSLQSEAYDKSSPWFYCDWGSRASYNKTAWLKPSEVADIVNVLLLAGKDSSVRDHVYQVDKPNPAGTDTWDENRVKDELKSRGGTPFNNLSSISVSGDFSSGRATSVNISGDGGSASFSGSDFKTYFNLRAPANIQIVGPLYNVESK